MTLSLSIVLPYYNEGAYLPTVLACAAAQDPPPHQLILVDNGSTDASRSICERLLAGSPLNVVHLTEDTPGKIAALRAGVARATGDVIVFWDADTRYPPGYLGACEDAFARAPTDTVAAMAIPLAGDPDSWWSRWLRLTYLARARLWPRQALTGGYGHAVRTDALRAAGGFSEERWPYVLLDHEMLHRVFARGRGRYAWGFWCRPSRRREDRRSVRWSLGERVLYHLTPFARKDWYFYRFLGPRLERRGLTHLNLRRQPWQAPAPASTPDGGESAPRSDPLPRP